MPKLDLSKKLTGIVITRSFQLSRNADEAKQKLGKTLTADFDFSNVTIQAGLEKAARQAVIDFQQPNRKHFDNFDDNENVGVIMVDEAGRQAPVDVEKMAANKFASSDFDGKVAQLVAITGMDEDAAKEIVSDQNTKDAVDK